jgi:hypothetical protein
MDTETLIQRAKARVGMQVDPVLSMIVCAEDFEQLQEMARELIITREAEALIASAESATREAADV